MIKARICRLEDGMFSVEVKDGGWRRWGSLSFCNKQDAEDVARYALRLLKRDDRRVVDRWEVS